jgi:predicted acetyltransferase
MPYLVMMARLQDERLGRNLEPGRVPHTMLYGFLGEDIIGRVSVRHELNEMLRARGGHLGYSVAPRFRGKGYATEMVRQALDYCRSLGLRTVLITCGETNVPSYRLIERLGGRLREKAYDEVDRETIRKYDLDLV